MKKPTKENIFVLFDTDKKEVSRYNFGAVIVYDNVDYALEDADENEVVLPLNKLNDELQAEIVKQMKL